jgi:hypothetical protein
MTAAHPTPGPQPTPPAPADMPSAGASGAVQATTLKFSAAAHRYWLDGRPIPGVTGLLGKGLPKPAIPYWAAKSVAEYVIANPQAVDTLREMGDGPAIAALKQVPWQQRDEAAVRGTDVHALADRVIHGHDVDVPDHLIDHVTGYARWLDEFDVVAIATERPVASRKWWYAGTFDGIVRMDRGPWAGRTVGLDIKTSKGVYGETALQIAAYMRAEFFVDVDNNEQPLPDVDCTAVVHVTDAGSVMYPLAHDRDEIDAQFTLFNHIAYVAKRTDDIKAYVGRPMHIEEVA